MDEISRAFEWITRHAFEPALFWVLDHPIISLVVVFAGVWLSVRNYRML
jgi:hypothetical protein